MKWTIFGIRHHGPGCACSLRAALTDLGPDVIAVEGPADAQEAVGLAGHADLKPPVAMLVYLPDEPAHAVYYPLAEFSPEWQAMQYGSQQGVPVRLIDLPQSVQFALAQQDKAGGDGPISRPQGPAPPAPAQPSATAMAPGADRDESNRPSSDPPSLISIPLALLRTGALIPSAC